jgi:exonuclease III
MVLDHGVIVPGRAQFVRLQWTLDIVIGIINIYGFNDIGSSTRLWRRVRNFPLPEANWILTDDLNMNEQLEDKHGGNPYTGKGCREIEAWNDLIIYMEIQDTFLVDKFRKTTTKCFTWDNQRAASDMVCTRLDRFYANHYIREREGLIGILQTSPHLSDHAPVFLRITKLGS